MRRHLAIFLLLISAMATALAQDQPFYRREIGGGVGITNYLGDFNSSLTKGFQPEFNVVYRRCFTPFSALKIDASYTNIKGSSKDIDTFYPVTATDEYSFKRSLYDLNFTYEYNFWPFGTGREYRGAKPLTPFIFFGLGLTMASGETDLSDSKTAVTANVPLGFGVKYKIAERLNLAVEWAVHFSLSDKLDGVTDPYGVTSKGLFKNTDCYSSLRATLTYCFSPKCATCNKDDW